MGTADRRALMAEDAEVCGEVRPDTLGYQRCVKTAAHDVHRSQDGKSWVSPQIDTEQSI